MSNIVAALGAAVAMLVGTPVAPDDDPVAHIAPVEDRDFYDDGRPDAAQVRLGNLLFFDKILSGNRNISCATCHHPRLGTSDGLSLGIGEGGVGLGPDRAVPAERGVLGRVPRNAPALYFLGARQFTRLTHDGRFEADPARTWPSGFWTPAREQLPRGLANVLAAQALFPLLSPVEMAGHKGENEVATAVALNRLAGPDGAWALLARRLQGIPGYVALFQAAFPEIAAAEDITLVHAANAVAAFEAAAFRPDDSPFDRYLRTRDSRYLTPAAQRGMALFYGPAGCAACHSGKFQTDHGFHAVAMPQVGPGKGDGRDQSYWTATSFHGLLEDHGRARVTGLPEDRFRFRTPSLRNVALTGPWGHAGTYGSLAAVVRHHLDPPRALAAYRVAAARLPALGPVLEPTAVGSRLQFRPVNPARLADHRRRDGWVQATPALRGAIAAANQLPPRRLASRDVADLVAFLEALTDPRSRAQEDLVPARVPSGLPVSD